MSKAKDLYNAVSIKVIPYCTKVICSECQFTHHIHKNVCILFGHVLKRIDLRDGRCIEAERCDECKRIF